jgi:hypothetical protein
VLQEAKAMTPDETTTSRRTAHDGRPMRSVRADRRGVDIPAALEQAVGDAVARRLETELGDRRLLLAGDDLAAAKADTARSGAGLLTSLIHRCYPIVRQADGEVELDFGGERGAARLRAALAFGAATARVLAPGPRNPDRELICATFNLGIGLVDSLCDADAESGGTLLELVRARDLAAVAAEPRTRGWLRAALPPALAADPSAAIAADVIETFFELLHDVYPDGAWRRRLGARLGAALAAERASIIPPANATRVELRQWSRLTSVLPFEIIETLARREHAHAAPTAGTQLGEAMWRIDDLVDLCQDARAGALNGILLAVGEDDVVKALERLLASSDIARAAGQAADDLQAGLRRADDPTAFLYFVQSYVGIAPRPAS